MILADTSAWIEYDRATGSPSHLRVKELIDSSGPLVVTEPVILEVLAGAMTDRREADLRQLLERFGLVSFDGADFDGALRIYRRCRSAGVTPRGMLDCMIASVAWRGGAMLLSHDVDMDHVAGVIGITLDPASLRA